MIARFILWVGALGGLAFTAFLACLTFAIGGFMEPMGVAWIGCFIASLILFEEAIRIRNPSKQLLFLTSILAIGFLQFVFIVVDNRS